METQYRWEDMHEAQGYWGTPWQALMKELNNTEIKEIERVRQDSLSILKNRRRRMLIQYQKSPENAMRLRYALKVLDERILEEEKKIFLK